MHSFGESEKIGDAYEKVHVTEDAVVQAGRQVVQEVYDST
jgi:hypothetical protein